MTSNRRGASTRLTGIEKEHNEQRISKYRDQAIAQLQWIEEEGDIEPFYNAIDDLQRLQSYLDLNATEYPIPPYTR